jgi:flagellar protein FlbT
MALKITLRPNERMIIGGAVVANGHTKCHLLVENTVPILREKDILSERDATTPCRRIYYVIQLMYIDNSNLVEYHQVYWQLVREVVSAAPSTLAMIDQISQHILTEKYYQALKLAKKLVTYEEELVSHAHQTLGCVQEDGTADGLGPSS